MFASVCYIGWDRKRDAELWSKAIELCRIGRGEIFE